MRMKMWWFVKSHLLLPTYRSVSMLLVIHYCISGRTTTVKASLTSAWKSYAGLRRLVY